MYILFEFRKNVVGNEKMWKVLKHQNPNRKNKRNAFIG